MTISSHHSGATLLVEMQEFASFPTGTQRYIRRSLDIALRRADPMKRWSRSAAEDVRIEAQRQAYRALDGLAALIPDGDGIAPSARLMRPLIALSAFDLAESRLPSFAAYRFLYERLLGAAARPWLPSAFCAAAALPHLHPNLRRQLLESLPCDEAAAPGWSLREPTFVPEWVDKVEDAIEV